MEDSSFPEVDPSKDLGTIIPQHGSSLHAVVPQDLPSPQQGPRHQHPLSRLQDPPALSSTRGLLCWYARHQDVASRHSCKKWSRRQEVFLPELGFLLSPSFLPRPPVFCLPKSPSRGPRSVATLLCLCTSTEVQRCSLETCVASCQPNHAGQQQTRVCGAVRCHSCSVVTS